MFYWKIIISVTVLNSLFIHLYFTFCYLIFFSCWFIYLMFFSKKNNNSSTKIKHQTSSSNNIFFCLKPLIICSFYPVLHFPFEVYYSKLLMTPSKFSRCSCLDVTELMKKRQPQNHNKTLNSLYNKKIKTENSMNLLLCLSLLFPHPAIPYTG